MKLYLGLAVLVTAFMGAEAWGSEVVGRQNETWDRYLDYAYIYSSATMPDLETRLGQYAVEARLTLPDYLIEMQTLNASEATPKSARTRRLAIGYLLEYLASGDPQWLEESVDTIDALAAEGGRHEDRYWYRYIHAHRALENTDSDEFVRQVFGLWFEGVAPIESSFDTVHALSLSHSANTGFVSALPYLYENVARLVLIRSRELGVERGLDPLAAIVRLLDDDRVGAYPRVVPIEVSSKAFLDRIMVRLDGPASDGGRLSFTLALFEAARQHETARSALASQGFTDETIDAIAIASGSYEKALGQAKTVLGRTAVYVQALRQLGEIYAAKQRLGVDPSVYMPFRIDDAIKLYSELFAAREEHRWLALGFRNTAGDAYVETLHGLWAEIQEAGMNLADFHLSRALADPIHADEHLRSAEQVYVRYLAIHRKYGDGKGSELVPDSATFGVYEAAKGFGDIHLLYSANDPSPSVAAAITEHYLIGLRACPFDRDLWATLATSLVRQDASGEFLGYAQPIVNIVKSSRRLEEWITMSRAGEGSIEPLRRALSDDRALLMMAFAGDGGEAALADELVGLEVRRNELDIRRADFEWQLLQLDQKQVGASEGSLAEADDDGLPSVSVGPPPVLAMDRESLLGEVASTESQIRELDSQIEGFEKALPLYTATAGGDELIQALRAQRDHPAHGLLRRLRREMSRKL